MRLWKQLCHVNTLKSNNNNNRDDGSISNSNYSNKSDTNTNNDLVNNNLDLFNCISTFETLLKSYAQILQKPSL